MLASRQIWTNSETLEIVIQYNACKVTIGAVWLVLLEGGIGSICSWDGSTWPTTSSNGDNKDVKVITTTKAIKNV